jgi:hypothetical protein
MTSQPEEIPGGNDLGPQRSSINALLEGDFESDWPNGEDELNQ